jgi:hypothetical protein
MKVNDTVLVDAAVCGIHCKVEVSALAAFLGVKCFK